MPSLSHACRQQIGGLLRQLCTGLGAKQLTVAARGLLASSAGVRSATLEALPHTPSLSQGSFILLCAPMQSLLCICAPYLQSHPSPTAMHPGLEGLLLACWRLMYIHAACRDMARLQP